MVGFRITQETNLVTDRNHKKILNILFRKTLTHHRDIRLVRRFIRGPKTRPGGEFKFEARTRKYQIQKKKKVGHLKPNVVTGETKERAKTAKVRATSKGGSIRFNSHFPLTEERRGEFERVSHKEQRADIKTMKREYSAMANSNRFKRKRRKRII